MTPRIKRQDNGTVERTMFDDDGKVSIMNEASFMFDSSSNGS